MLYPIFGKSSQIFPEISMPENQGDLLGDARDLEVTFTSSGLREVRCDRQGRVR
jgi:hypothetical protein